MQRPMLQHHSKKLSSMFSCRKQYVPAKNLESIALSLQGELLPTRAFAI
jgi:hypothetical protein